MVAVEPCDVVVDGLVEDPSHTKERPFCVQGSSTVQAFVVEETCCVILFGHHFNCLLFVEQDDIAALLHLQEVHFPIRPDKAKSLACVVVQFEVKKGREDLRSQGPGEGKLSKPDDLLDKIWICLKLA